MCDGLGKIVDCIDTVNAVGDASSRERIAESVGNRQKICIALDSFSTVDVMPADELC